ncbi:hypothetical protein [Brumimicrobium salinarum]|nr:hypothetical protein [Brumimicrobium salinarum]
MKISYFLILFFGLALSSCTSKSADEQTTKHGFLEASKEIAQSYNTFDLRPYEISAAIKLPTDKSISVLHELDAFDWEILNDDQPFLIIQDWGAEDAIGHHLEKIENETASIEILEKNEHLVLYKAAEENSEHIYHAAVQHKIDEINFLFLSPKNGLTEEQLISVLAAMKSVEVYSR